MPSWTLSLVGICIGGYKIRLRLGWTWHKDGEDHKFDIVEPGFFSTQYPPCVWLEADYKPPHYDIALFPSPLSLSAHVPTHPRLQFCVHSVPNAIVAVRLISCGFGDK